MDMNNKLLALAAGFIVTGVLAFAVIELFEMTRLDAGQFQPMTAVTTTHG